VWFWILSFDWSHLTWGAVENLGVEAPVFDVSANQRNVGLRSVKWMHITIAASPLLQLIGYYCMIDYDCMVQQADAPSARRHKARWGTDKQSKQCCNYSEIKQGELNEGSCHWGPMGGSHKCFLWMLVVWKQCLRLKGSKLRIRCCNVQAQECRECPDVLFTLDLFNGLILRDREAPTEAPPYLWKICGASTCQYEIFLLVASVSMPM